jgi:hypothetical protein
MVVPPSLKLTEPVAPEVTVAVKVIGVPRFCGLAGDAVSVVVDEASAGDVEAVSLPDGPAPPELSAVTLNVYEVLAA